MRKGLIGTLAASMLAIVIGISPVLADSPHFVPSAWMGISDKFTGDYTVGYMVAGLGSDASGKVVTKGWFRMSCDGPNANLTNKKWTRRAMLRDQFASVDGMNRDYDVLHANPCTNRNFSGMTVEWACVSSTLYDLSNNELDKGKFEWGTPEGRNQLKCDQLQ